MRGNAGKVLLVLVCISGLAVSAAEGHKPSKEVKRCEQVRRQQKAEKLKSAVGVRIQVAPVAPQKGVEEKIAELKKELQAVLEAIKKEKDGRKRGQLKRRAAGIERQLKALAGARRRRRAPRPDVARPRPPQARIAAVQRLLEQAKRRHDHRQVRRLEGILRELKRTSAAELDLVKLIDRVAQLRKEALRLKRAGKHEEAKRKWLEADSLDKQLHRRMGVREKREPEPRRRSARRERPEGPPPREAQLDALMREREELRRHLEEIEGPKMHDIDRAIEELKEVIRRLDNEEKRVGPRKRLAELTAQKHQLKWEADRIRRRLRELEKRIAELHPPAPGRRPPAPPEAERAEALRREARGLEERHRELERRLHALEEEHRRTAGRLEELADKIERVEGPAREELQAERRRLEALARAIEERAEGVRARMHEIERRLEEVKRELERVEGKPDPWEEIERLRAEIRQLREILNKALRER